MDVLNGPIITAPALRTTKSGEQMVQYLKTDIAQVAVSASLWVRQTAEREINNQIALGNSKQYVAIVDGSKGAPVNQAKQKVQVYFVTTLLARKLEQAKPVLMAAIRRVTNEHTGLLANGWTWYLQRGGKSGSTEQLGGSLPSDLQLRTGDALILAPAAPYAWFANYNASRAGAFVPTEIKKARAGKVSRRKRPPRGFGFMAYAARRLRGDLTKIGVSVWPRFSTKLAPPGTRAKFGVPILVFVVSSRLRSLH